MDGHILVVGATLMDIKGRPTAGMEPGTSNPAKIRTSRGGTARNVAENLVCLGAEVVLISAVGDDSAGQLLLTQSDKAGINTDEVLVVPRACTGSYIAILEEDGSLAVALDDVGVMEYITPSFLDRRRSLFRDAAMVIFDGGLPSNSMQTVIRLANQYHKPISADPSSTRMAHRLLPYLPELHLVVPNEREAAILCGVDYDEPDFELSQQMARQLTKMGVEIAIVTLSNYGLIYATSDEHGYIPPSYSEIVDSTGTGDALTAAVVYGLMNDLPTTDCMRLGAAAVGLTLQTSQTVVPDLSLDLLYDHLFV